MKIARICVGVLVLGMGLIELFSFFGGETTSAFAEATAVAWLILATTMLRK